MLFIPLSNGVTISAATLSSPIAIRFSWSSIWSQGEFSERMGVTLKCCPFISNNFIWPSTYGSLTAEPWSVNGHLAGKYLSSLLRAYYVLSEQMRRSNLLIAATKHINCILTKLTNYFVCFGHSLLPIQPRGGNPSGNTKLLAIIKFIFQSQLS